MTEYVADTLLDIDYLGKGAGGFVMKARTSSRVSWRKGAGR